MFGFTRPSILRAAGIVGMNRRNVAYISPYNPRRLYPRVDDKLITKKITQAVGIPVPKLIGAVKAQHQTRQLAEFMKAHHHFVIKPSKGSGGKGILVIIGREGDCFIKPSGERCTIDDVKRHVSNILSGLFSLGGKPDVAMIEDMVHFTDDFVGFSYQGVPDIRVILFQGYPVMAMTRLSTQESDGKANLHQGAVGVGLDIATGKALRGVQHARPVSHHPDTGKRLADLHIPHWQDLLILASRCYEVTGLGYLGADIVIDKHRGPLMLELNARPGLSIQIANGQGLLPRLALIEAQAGLARDAMERVVFSMENFPATIQHSAE